MSNTTSAIKGFMNFPTQFADGTVIGNEDGGPAFLQGETITETIEHLALPADKRGAVVALCEWYARHAVDSNYELYCDDNEMRAGTKASMIEWLHDMWTEFA